MTAYKTTVVYTCPGALFEHRDSISILRYEPVSRTDACRILEDEYGIYNAEVIELTSEQVDIP